MHLRRLGCVETELEGSLVVGAGGLELAEPCVSDGKLDSGSAAIRVLLAQAF